MKKFFALICVFAVVTVHVVNWILCGSDMSILDHVLMTVGLVASCAAFIKMVRLYNWKETISTSGGAMMLSSVGLLLTELMAVDWGTAPDIYVDALSAMPVMLLLYGGSTFLWAEIYEGNFSADIPVTAIWVKSFAVLFTSLACLCTLSLIEAFISVPRLLFGATEVVVCCSGIAWIILMIVFIWQSFRNK